MPIFSKVEDFCKDFREYGRCLAVDYGTRKIGISVGDFENKVAFPKQVLFGDWRNLTDAVDVVLAEILVENAHVIVLGLPKSLDGTENEKCAFVRQIADGLLKEKDKLKIFLIDERFSTKATQSWMNFERRKMEKKINRTARYGNDSKPDDASAASILLDTFFEMTTNFCEKNDNQNKKCL